MIDVDEPHVVRLRDAARPAPLHACATTSPAGGEWGDVQWSPGRAQPRVRLHLARPQARAAAGRRRRHRRGARRARREGLRRSSNRATAASTGSTCRPPRRSSGFRERDNWGQLYLYDSETGKLKNQITTGEGNVTQLLRVDEKNRACSISSAWAARRAATRISFTSTASGSTARNLALLTPEDANHEVSFSPSGRYFVDSYSRPDVPPVAVLRDDTGQAGRATGEGRHLETAGRRLEAAHPDHGEGARRRTDLYGLMFKPVNLDRSKKYPIVNHIYPGPQTGSVGSRSFSAARGDAQALAELGFIVVEIDGMGTPWRSKKFHEAYYGDMGDNTLPDQVAGMKQLAAALPVDRPRSRRHLRALRRRLRHGRRDVPLPRFLQGGDLRGRQPRQPRIRRRLGREVAGAAEDEPRRHDELRQPGQPELSPRT